MNTGDDAGRPSDDGRSAPRREARVTYLPGVSPPATAPLPGISEDQLPSAIPEAESGTPSSAASDAASDRRSKRAANVSLNALTRRGMSRWELEKTLASRELEPHEIEAELARLESVGLIDDAALADTFVRTQHERKGLGRGALVGELRRRHIDQEHIEAALEQLGDDSELERARELATRRAPQLRSLDSATAKRRLTGFLMRKGYSSGIIRTAVDEALDAGHGTVRFR